MINSINSSNLDPSNLDLVTGSASSTKQHDPVTGPPIGYESIKSSISVRPLTCKESVNHAAAQAGITEHANQAQEKFAQAHFEATEARKTATALTKTMNDLVDTTSLWQRIFGYPVEVKNAIKTAMDAHETALQKEGDAQEKKLSHDVLTAISNSNLNPAEQVTKYHEFEAAHETAKKLRAKATLLQQKWRRCSASESIFSGRTERAAYDDAIYKARIAALEAEDKRNILVKDIMSKYNWVKASKDNNFVAAYENAKKLRENATSLQTKLNKKEVSLSDYIFFGSTKRAAYDGYLKLLRLEVNAAEEQARQAERASNQLWTIALHSQSEVQK